jgi:hypothetical protein
MFPWKYCITEEEEKEGREEKGKLMGNIFERP